MAKKPQARLRTPILPHATDAAFGLSVTTLTGQTISFVAAYKRPGFVSLIVHDGNDPHHTVTFPAAKARHLERCLRAAAREADRRHLGRCLRAAARKAERRRTRGGEG